MVDSVKRQLRDGVADGEQAPSIMLRDTVETTGGPPLLKHFLLSVCDNVSRGRAQAKGVVAVALSETPESYSSIPCASAGDRGSLSWFQLLDCYTDPLGWIGPAELQGLEVGVENAASSRACKNIRDLDGLLSLIIMSGQCAVDFHPKERFVVVFDSISVLLRHHSVQALLNFLSGIRSHEHVSDLLWLVHADLHDSQTVLSLEYFSTSIIHVERFLEVPQDSADTADIQQDNSHGGLVRIRQKRRNGRIREQSERFYFTAQGLSFGPLKKVETVKNMTGKNNIPQVQFNLTLTEKEMEDRSKVVLPFEHQGNGQEAKIYDGRDNIMASYLVSQARETRLAEDSSLAFGVGEIGEIHYLRDSDDERPDSDEDPDDDLDI